MDEDGALTCSRRSSWRGRRGRRRCRCRTRTGWATTTWSPPAGPRAEPHEASEVAAGVGDEDEGLRGGAHAEPHEVLPGAGRRAGGDVGVAVPVVPRVVGERCVRSGLDQPEPRRRPAPTVDLGLGAGFLVAEAEASGEEAEAAQGGGGGGAGRRRRQRGEGGGDRGSSGATGDRAMRSNYFPSVGRVLHLPVAQVITVRHGYAATRGAHVCAAPRLSAHRPDGQGPSWPWRTS